MHGNRLCCCGRLGVWIHVFTSGGSIEINKVEANDNYLYGANLEGAGVDISPSVSSSNNGSGIDNKPVGYGLKVVSQSEHYP